MHAAFSSSNLCSPSCPFFCLFCFFVCESGRFSWIFRMKPVFIVTAFMCTYVLLDESLNVLLSDV